MNCPASFVERANRTVIAYGCETPGSVEVLEGKCMSDSAAPFLTARWQNLVMLNYEIDSQLLQSRIPAGTELDLWNGRAFVSLVGFRFLQTRVMGWSIPFHVNFDEVNLRFYVRHKSGSEWRRGVVFIREIVPRTAIALVARWAYHEQYIALPMRSRIDLPNSQTGPRGSVSYSWKWAGAWCELAAEIIGEPQLLDVESEAGFITEHYWGYAAQKDGSTLEYQVEHPAWRVWQAQTSCFTGETTTLYGPALADVLQAPPCSAFVAEGSEIVVRRGTPTRIESR